LESEEIYELLEHENKKEGLDEGERSNTYLTHVFSLSQSIGKQ
jgi:hypothetical protein